MMRQDSKELVVSLLTEFQKQLDERDASAATQTRYIRAKKWNGLEANRLFFISNHSVERPSTSRQ